MSHNTITVGAQSPDANANVSIALNNLSDVNISNAQNQQVLKFSSSNLVNDSFQASVSTQNAYSVFQRNDTSFFSHGASTTNSYDVNDYLFLPSDSQTGRTRSYIDTSLAQSINATSTNSIKSNTRAFESVKVKTAGTYLCRCSVPLRSWGAAAGYVVRFHSNNGAFGAKNNVQSIPVNSALVVGIVTVSANDRIRVVIESENGSTLATGSAESGSFGFFIQKLS